MKKIRYSKDADAMLIEISDEPIAYAEDEGKIILHYSNSGELVLIEIVDIKELISTEACNNFDKIYDEAISSREPIAIIREGSESVSVIPTAELNSIMETLYLFQSHKNAARLLDALQRTKARTNKPKKLEDLRKEFGLFEEVKV